MWYVAESLGNNLYNVYCHNCFKVMSDKDLLKIKGQILGVCKQSKRINILSKKSIALLGKMAVFGKGFDNSNLRDLSDRYIVKAKINSNIKIKSFTFDIYDTWLNKLVFTKTYKPLGNDYYPYEYESLVRFLANNSIYDLCYMFVFYHKAHYDLPCIYITFSYAVKVPKANYGYECGFKTINLYIDLFSGDVLLETTNQNIMAMDNIKKFM